MKLVIIEPLGVNDEKLLSMAKDMLPADLEIVYYNTRVTDTETLIERGRDAGHHRRVQPSHERRRDQWL